MNRQAWSALALVTILLCASLVATAQTASDRTTGRRVEFPLTRFNDTLFVAHDGAHRVAFDEAGDVWYTDEGGVVHVDLATRQRETFTKYDGLPSSFSMGIAAAHGKVYVGTDLGLGIIDRATGDVSSLTPANSPLRDNIVQAVTIVGDDVWLGTRFHGVAIWNATKPAADASAWTFHNTSSAVRFAKPVSRIQPTETSIWVPTLGDGLWRYDRATANWSVVLRADGLLSNIVTAVAERGNDIWVGTDKGLQKRAIGAVGADAGSRNYTMTNSGLPENIVNDVDVIPTAEGNLEVFASTKAGLWQLNPESNLNATRAQAYGILGVYILDNVYEPSKGWAFGSTRGVSLLREGKWSYFTTGPSTGISPGPGSFGFTSASVGENGDFLWFGSSEGVSVYRLPRDGVQGFWQNFGEWQDYPGSVVNFIDTEGNTTWLATNQGVFGFSHETGAWIPKLSNNSRNLAYGLDVDRGELWVGLFGDGLIMENLTTRQQRAWTPESTTSRIPSKHITDVRVDGDNVWLASTAGLMQLDRISGQVVGPYTRADGVPGDGVIYRTLPEGPTVWLGTKSGGVAKFDVASGKVSRVWNASNTPGFPTGEIRSMLREGSRLWIGLGCPEKLVDPCDAGLARIDLVTGNVRAWNQTNSGLVQAYVNGISEADGILYVATLSGISRMDVVTGEFFPMRDGPGVIRTSVSVPGGGTSGGARVSVRIESPRDGGAIAGASEIRGTALAFGAAVDRVEVKIGLGEWQTASGRESWTFPIDAALFTPNEPIPIFARAFSGNATSREAEILVTPVAAPKIPLTLSAVALPNATANRPLQVAARATGDDPLAVYFYYLAPGTSTYQRVLLEPEGSLFSGVVPARNMREGEMRYYFEAQSGLLVVNDAGSRETPVRLSVAPAPSLAVVVDAPAQVRAKAGVTTPLPLNVTNAGTEPASFTLTAAGVRASWVTVPADTLDLQPGETRLVTAQLEVPLRAVADNTTLSFEARDTAGLADPATARVPIEVLASEEIERPTATAPTGGAIPMPILAPLLAAAAVALLLRRRSA